jgi:proteasome alpha subunit
MAESGGSSAGFGTRYPYYYGPEGRLVLVDSALEAVNKGSTTIGIKTPVFALISSHIKPTRPLIEPNDILRPLCPAANCEAGWPNSLASIPGAV